MNIFRISGSHRLARRFIFTERTPNPLAIKFFPSSGDVTQSHADGAVISFGATGKSGADIPLVSTLLSLDGVVEVMLAPSFLTIIVSDVPDWWTLQPRIEDLVQSFFDGEDGPPSDFSRALTTISSPIVPVDGHSIPDRTVEDDIKDLIEERVRPHVQADGGDVEYHGFDFASGIVKLALVGACSSCPSSTVTMRFMIKNLLCHYIPDVKDVEPVTVPEQSDMTDSGSGWIG